MFMKAIMSKPSVLITAIICGCVLGLGLLFVVGWLIYANRDTQTILTLVSLFLTAFLYKRVGDVDTRTARVEQNVNGNTSKLMDAVIQSPAVMPGKD
jgi:hypothetical protein